MASCVLQRCRRNQALAKLSQAKSCTSLIPHSAAGTGWVDGLQTNSSVDPLPSSFSTQNTAPLSATKSSSTTEPARAALSNRILPPPAFVWLRIHHCPACIPATRQLPHVLLSQHTCWWPWLLSYHPFYLFLLLDLLLGSFPSLSSPCTPDFCSSQLLVFPTLLSSQEWRIPVEILELRINPLRWEALSECIFTARKYFAWQWQVGVLKLSVHREFFPHPSCQ